MLVSKQLMQDIVTYLETQPYGHVANLITRIVQEANAQPKEDLSEKKAEEQ